MDFTALPPELVSQMPLVAVLLWLGVQSRKELIAAIGRLSDRIDQVRLEVRALRSDLGRPELHDEPQPGGNGSAELHR